MAALLFWMLTHEPRLIVFEILFMQGKANTRFYKCDFDSPDALRPPSATSKIMKSTVLDLSVDRLTYETTRKPLVTGL